MNSPSHYEWCSDSGNDIDDLASGSIQMTNTNVTVNVGGGEIVSKCIGTVFIQSCDFPDVILKCDNVIFLSDVRNWQNEGVKKGLIFVGENWSFLLS